jgi:hypothetical protein
MTFLLVLVFLSASILSTGISALDTTIQFKQGEKITVVLSVTSDNTLYQTVIKNGYPRALTFRFDHSYLNIDTFAWHTDIAEAAVSGTYGESSRFRDLGPQPIASRGGVDRYGIGVDYQGVVNGQGESGAGFVPGTNLTQFEFTAIKAGTIADADLYMEAYDQVIIINATVNSGSSSDPQTPATVGGGITGDNYNVTWNYGGAVTGSGTYSIEAIDGYAIDEIYVDGALAADYAAYHGEDEYSYSGTITQSLSVHFAHTINFPNPADASLSVSRVGSDAAIQSGEIVYDGEVLNISAPDSEFTTTGLKNNGDGTYTVLAKRGEATPSITVTADGDPGDDEGPGESLTVHAQAGYGGTVTKNDDGKYTVTPTVSGYVIDQIWVDDVEVTDFTRSEAYTTAKIPKQSIFATFEHTINFLDPANGTLSVSRESKTLTSEDIVRDGETLTITAAPGKGYILEALTLAGFENNIPAANGDGTYTVVVAAPRLGQAPSVSATFAESEAYPIYVTQVQGGTVTVSPASAAEGTRVTVTGAPDADYRLAGLKYTTGDGTWITIYNGVFTMPGSSVTVTAVFEAKEPADLVIETAAQLAAFRDNVNNGTEEYDGKVVRLGKDIDLTGLDWNERIGKIVTVYDEKGYWVRNDLRAFRGTFDGDGHTITLGGAGLFLYTQGAVVKNLTTDGLANTSPIAEYGYGSAFIGCVNNANVVVNVESYSNVNVNGIAGCAAPGLTSGYGGVNRELPAAECGIFNCVNRGDISVIGALADNSENQSVGVIHYHYENFPTGNYITGLGYKAERIVDSANTGNIFGGSMAAPSHNISALGSANAIIRSYNTGNFTSHKSIISAMNAPYIVDSYNTGNIAHTELIGDQSQLSHVNAFYGLGMAGTYGSGFVNLYNTGSRTSAIKNSGSRVETADYYSAGAATNNVYTAAGAKPTAAQLGPAFKDDVNNINGGLPLLIWQSDTAPSGKFDVSFAVTPANANAEVRVFSDANRENELTAASGVYTLSYGTYFYEVTAQGYVTARASFNVRYSNKSESVALRAAANVTLTVTPASASLTLTDAGGGAVEPNSVSGANGAYTYELYAGDMYTYTADAPGYNGTSREFKAGDAGGITITLTESAHPGNNTGGGGEPAETVIYGDGNTGQTNAITTGGTYYLAKGAIGVLTINTTQPVTLVGTGISLNNAYKDLYIVCAQEGTSLTLQDIYISNDRGSSDPKLTNMIDFRGSGNSLYFKGTSILDQNTNASGYAMIHVNTETELTVGGVTPYDTLYFYKREQGAGIGGNGNASGSEGQSPEYNGKITITGGNLFMKSSKQGALIGSGADASSTNSAPGDITILGGVLNLLPIARGAAIGGSAGSSGGARGANVYINGGTITINVDYDGAAIGGGGYDSGNDAEGGVMYYGGGSIRTFIDYNAVDPDGRPGTADSLWGSFGVYESGVNDAAITADKRNTSGKSVYLLTFDTSKLDAKGTRAFTVLDGTAQIYSGGLHEYSYVNENLQKDSQLPINYTLDNWVPLNDPNLYLYLTGENHTLTVNGESFTATWNASTEKFTVTDAAGATVNDPPGETTAIAKTTVEEDAATTIVDDPIALGSDPTLVVINVETNGATVNTITAAVTAENVKAIAENGSAIEVRSDLGNITLPNEAVKALSGSAEKQVDVKLTKNSADTYTLALTADDKAVATVDGGVKLTLPAENVSPGTVAVLVNADGSEKVIKKSVGKDGKVSIPLDGSATIKIVDNAKAFADVSSDAWYSDGVKFTSSHELFQGTDDGGFAPEMSMTRGMLATVLHRLENAPTATGELFSDVAGDAYYAEAIIWASANSIVNGTGDGFAPDAEINREQLAVMLYRYYVWFAVGDGVPDVPSSGTLDAFPDAAEASDWAEEALKWAVAVGLIQGRDSGLAPKGTATRAEVAVILERFIENIL